MQPIQIKIQPIAARLTTVAADPATVAELAAKLPQVGGCFAIAARRRWN
jgi:hypothetical protein